MPSSKNLNPDISAELLGGSLRAIQSILKNTYILSADEIALIILGGLTLNLREVESLCKEKPTSILDGEFEELAHRVGLISQIIKQFYAFFGERRAPEKLRIHKFIELSHQTAFEILVSGDRIQAVKLLKCVEALNQGGFG